MGQPAVHRDGDSLSLDAILKRGCLNYASLIDIVSGQLPNFILEEGQSSLSIPVVESELFQTIIDDLFSQEDLELYDLGQTVKTSYRLPDKKRIIFQIDLSKSGSRECLKIALPEFKKQENQERITAIELQKYALSKQLTEIILTVGDLPLFKNEHAVDVVTPYNTRVRAKDIYAVVNFFASPRERGVFQTDYEVTFVKDFTVGKLKRSYEISVKTVNNEPKMIMIYQPSPRKKRQEQAVAKIELVKLANIDQLLKIAAEQEVSDIHLKSGRPPAFRKGKLKPLEGAAVLTPKNLEDITLKLIGKEKWQQFQQKGVIDTSYRLEVGDGKECRYRLNISNDDRGIFIVARVIPSEILSARKLGFPYDEIWQEIPRIRKGLVLVTGSTGAGKTTTVASLINEINIYSESHIITIEDPIEYVYPQGGSIKSYVSQREVGNTVKSYERGVIDALRQDPDVILIGEIRDKIVAKQAIDAASTGHLVFATLHTKNAIETVRRFSSFFPVDEQGEIRGTLASHLCYIISQQLVPAAGRADAKIPAMEILNVKNLAVENHLREGQYTQLQSAMQTGMKYHMLTGDAHLMQLCRERKISPDTARSYASDPTNMKHL